jgi:WD40 repeat protein
LPRPESFTCVAGACRNRDWGARDSPNLLKDVKAQVVDTKRTVYDLYRFVLHSKNAIAMSSLSVIGNGHPFIPSESPLRRVFGIDTTSQCRIVAKHMGTNQGWSSQVLKIKMNTFVKDAVFSPDGCHLATTSLHHTVHVWDAGTGAHLRELDGHTNVVESIAFSPDGRHLASASRDCTVCVWDAATGAPLRVLQGHSNTVNSVSFSLDSRHLASASSDCTVRVWDVATGASLRELKGHAGAVQGVAISPDGHRLASGSDDRTVRLWDVATGASLRKLKKHAGKVYSVAFSPDGHCLASASADCTVRVWDLANGVTFRELKGHHRPVVSVAFSPDGHHLASASADYTVRMWDVVTGGCFKQLQGHYDRVVSVAFSPDGRHLASASWDRTARVWDVMTGAPFQELRGHTTTVTSITFSPNGHHLASTSDEDDYTIQVWDVADGRSIVQRKLKGQNHPREVSFSPDGSMLMLQHSHGESHLHFPSLETITRRTPLSSVPFRSAPSSFIYIDQNSICIKRQDRTLRICWLPDYFKPTTPVVQHGDHVCIGGEEGMIAFINLGEFTIPDI